MKTKVNEFPRSLSYCVLALALLFTACESESVDEVVPEPDQITFTKGDGADPTVAANQDRITDNVWITRGNDGGQIFNIQVNSVYNKDTSPVDTEWAIGSKENRESLTFGSFRNTIKPQEAVGRDLVMHLISDDIYLNVRFTRWASGKQGGFTYIRDEVPQ
ncbi:MAG: hypothetical protein AAGC88_15055 [Bacteroidota bacterium]